MAGERIEKTPGNGKKVWIIAGVVLAVLVCAYLGLCAWAGTCGIMANVTAGGLDVSGMTAAQAEAALDQAVQERGEQTAVTLRYGGWTGTLTGRDVQVDSQASAQAAWEVGRSNFFVQGFWWLVHQMGMSDQVDLVLELSGTAEQLLDEADQKEGGVTSARYMVEGEALVVTKGVTGVAIDREQARQDIASAFQEAFSQTLSGRQEEAGSEVELAAQEAAPQELDFEAIHQELYTQPQNAQVDPETYQATDHVVGVDFDPVQAQALYDAAGEGETVSIPLTLTQPEETKEELEAKLFRDLLGEGTSEVSGSANRKYNVKLSAEACNGVVLMPGEEFSYNNTTGSRTADKGYRDAPTYVAGESVDNVGGGICQTSSTIYYAVLHTTLEVVERHDHQFAVGYVPDGMDATVWYGSLDFRFKNNTNYPVKVVTESYDKNGARYLTVKIYGTNEDGRYAVPDNSVFDRVYPTTQYRADESIPQGTTKVDSKQNAYIGRKARTYRYIYDKDGNLLEKQDLGVSSYEMRPKTILYNPADGDPASWVDGVPGTGQTTETVNPGDGGQTGQTTDPGTGGQTGQTTDPGTGGQTGQTTDPGDGGQTGQTTDSGTGGQTGQTTDPGTGDQTGQAANPDAGGQTDQPAAPAGGGETEAA